DVFYLWRHELADALDRDWGEPLQAVVAERADARKAAARALPVPFLGDPPDPHADLPPMVAKFYGVPGSASRDGDLLKGTPASPMCRVDTGTPSRSPSSRPRPRTPVQRVSLAKMRRVASTWSSRSPSRARRITNSRNFTFALKRREYLSRPSRVMCQPQEKTR